MKNCKNTQEQSLRLALHKKSKSIKIDYCKNFLNLMHFSTIGKVWIINILTFWKNWRNFKTTYLISSLSFIRVEFIFNIKINKLQLVGVVVYDYWNYWINDSWTLKFLKSLSQRLSGILCLRCFMPGFERISILTKILY